MLSVVCQVYQVKININLVNKLRHTRAIHLAMKRRKQRRFYGSGELRLRLLPKSLIYGLLSIEISLQLCNLVLHVLQQLHKLLGISKWLGSHIEYMHSEQKGGTAMYVEFQYTKNTKTHTESQCHS